MTREDPRRATKYFGEGVSASIWSCAPERWEIRFRRESQSASCLDLDTLKRGMARVIDDGDSQYRIYFGRDNELTLYSLDAFKAFSAEVERALDFIRSVSLDDEWRDLPASIVKIADIAVSSIRNAGRTRTVA